MESNSEKKKFATLKANSFPVRVDFIYKGFMSREAQRESQKLFALVKKYGGVPIYLYIFLRSDTSHYVHVI